MSLLILEVSHGEVHLEPWGILLVVLIVCGLFAISGAIHNEREGS